MGIRIPVRFLFIRPSGFGRMGQAQPIHSTLDVDCLNVECFTDRMLINCSGNLMLDIKKFVQQAFKNQTIFPAMLESVILVKHNPYFALIFSYYDYDSDSDSSSSGDDLQAVDTKIDELVTFTYFLGCAQHSLKPALVSTHPPENVTHIAICSFFIIYFSFIFSKMFIGATTYCTNGQRLVNLTESR